MSKADVFVCSYTAEGFSTVATESLILNTPIITTNCAGMRELFGGYECGVITENSIDGLYNGMKAILDDNSLIEKFKLNEEKFFFLN